MSVVGPISLLPLSEEHHIEALQEVYNVTPGYWQMYELPASPANQAARDLQAVAETPGRYMMGIVRRVDVGDPSAGAELIGLIDFRLNWQAENQVYIGMVMVAKPYQRRGVATQAWALLEPWLAEEANIERARLGVEQFNPDALQFFQTIGFVLTGESNRVQSGTKWVRLLYMEKELTQDP